MSMRPPPRFSLPLPTGQSVAAEFRVNARARRITLRIDPALREVILTVPNVRAAEEARRFAHDRAMWIATQLARLGATALVPVPGGLLVRGAPTLVEHRLDGRGVSLEAGPPQKLIVRGRALTQEGVTARALAFCREQARADLARCVAVHAETLQVEVTGLAIKDTRSRWGSCTAAGKLSFSWRLIGAPPSVLDYVAAHEVAHLREMNHSDRFWALVARCCPGYARERAWLRTHGHTLHAMQP